MPGTQNTENANVSANLPSLEEITAKVMGGTTEVVKTEAKAENLEESQEVVTPAVEPKAEEKKDPRYSSKFAAIAKREKEARVRERDAENRQKAIEAREADLKKKETIWEERKKSPLKALEAAGYSYSDATQAVLGTFEEAKPDPEAEWKASVEARIAKAEESEKKLEEYKAQVKADQITQAETAIRENLRDAISENTDKFEICATMGEEAIELAREVLQIYYDKHGEILTYDQILDSVEKHYEERVLKRLLTTKKLKEQAGLLKQTAPTIEPKKTPRGASATITQAAKASSDMVDVDQLPKDQALDYLIKKHLA